ncbi:hypothetical protein PRIPAC_89539 [Pristionchus pacificus]|uniref:Uncharacterized protein n=1 Tax=Pristionchus pacificus TaxID=54126 RepID=A0A2A6B3Y6_PRIPA|nr:hypothetical protein PRIPAC_89539 [Pristionchus pacificus]|eukprot:PDM60590.1 hypothetical protein PRIPAC_53568 [Pristionchus pacificus]
MLATLVTACALLFLLEAAPISEFADDDDFSFYGKGIDFTDYVDHQPSSANVKESLFEIHPRGEHGPPHIREHREHVAAVEEKRRQLRERHHGADFLFLAPTTNGGIHSPSHILDPSSPIIQQLQDKTWQRANAHNPWFRIAWPQGAHGGKEPTRLGYDYKKGGYSWGGYGTFGAIDIWEEQDDSEDEEKDDEDDPFESHGDQRPKIIDHSPSSIVPPLLPILDHESKVSW